MEQKFVNFEEAVEKLGISAERLNQLREDGQLRAYRDGASWKFRTDEIEKMVAEGVPQPAPPSDLGLADLDDLVESSPIELEEDDDLKLAIEPGDESGLDLAELDDTVTAGTSDVMLDAPKPAGDPSDSILLSEEQLGESARSHGSTVIGKDAAASDDADLKLATDDDTQPSASGASDVLSSGIAGSGVLDQLQGSSGGMSAFEDLDELELDLEAESSRILSPEEAAPAKAENEAAAASDKDLILDDELLAVAEGDDDSDMGSTDVPLDELGTSTPTADEGSGSDIELAGDDDLLSPDAGGSDITLDSGDSGINLLPSDSGLALDDIPLDVGGSAILSSLSLEGSDPEISLLGDSASATADSGVDIQTDDDFQLTPHGKSDVHFEDEDSSSQVIALDAGIDDLGAEVGDVLGEDAFTEDVGADAAGLSDLTEHPTGAGVAMGYSSGLVLPTAESPYTVPNLIGLGGCVVLLLFASIMSVDMVRNIWSWDEPFSLNSSLMDAILSWLP